MRMQVSVSREPRLPHDGRRRGACVLGWIIDAVDEAAETDEEDGGDSLLWTFGRGRCLGWGFVLLWRWVVDWDGGGLLFFAALLLRGGGHPGENDGRLCADCEAGEGQVPEDVVDESVGVDACSAFAEGGA
jgi:hypothetical protein